MIKNPCAEMIKAARDIFVANTKFHGVFGFGYGINKSSNLNSPLTKSAVINAFQIIKL